jgi:hypothetical protein
MMLCCAVDIRAFGAATVSADVTPTFEDDLNFLRQYTPVAILKSREGTGLVAVTPAWQGRVMTSSAQSVRGRSFGWINRKLIGSGEQLQHFNPLGGEDRLWLGPEGGQFSIYFAPGASFDLDHWFVPAALDTLPFQVKRQSRDSISLEASLDLTNHSGTKFSVLLHREVKVLAASTAWQLLGAPQARNVNVVAYQSRNTLTNAGRGSWRKDTGLLSIWILGMFNPTPAAAIVIPTAPGPEAQLGPRVTSDYFGAIPADRLKVTDGAVFLRADGQLRSKIGVNPRRSLGKLGCYDAMHQVLTIVQFDQSRGVTDYVNSLWKIQNDPYGGDVANAYNDGPPAPGVPPMGPFIELESSSPAAALAPGGQLTHTHRTFHLKGPESELDRISIAVLGVSLAQIKDSLGDPRQ